MINKVAVSHVDPKTGVETKAQEITPAPNGDYTVIRGAKLAKSPTGEEWTADSLSSVTPKVVAQIPQQTTTTVRSMGQTIEFNAAAVAKNIYFTPSDNMEFSTDPNDTTEYTIGWEFDDLESMPQVSWRVRIFPDFIVQSSDFDPNTNKNIVFEAQASDDTNQISLGKQTGFISGEKYWVYVQVGKNHQNTIWMGDWTSEPFNVVIEQPQAPILSVYTDNANSINVLTIQSTDNLFNGNNGDFNSSIGGWNATQYDTAGTSLDIGTTGISLNTNLSTNKKWDSVPVGATGYLSTTTDSGVSFTVSGSNGKNTPPLYFPTNSAGKFWVQIDNEKILVTNNFDGQTATDTDTFTIVQRGYLGTTPASHSQWAKVLYGLQQDIYVGNIGTLNWSEKITVNGTTQVPTRTSTGTAATTTSLGVGPFAIQQTGGNGKLITNLTVETGKAGSAHSYISVPKGGVKATIFIPKTVASFNANGGITLNSQAYTSVSDLTQVNVTITGNSTSAPKAIEPRWFGTTTSPLSWGTASNGSYSFMGFSSGLYKIFAHQSDKTAPPSADVPYLPAGTTIHLQYGNKTGSFVLTAPFATGTIKSSGNGNYKTTSSLDCNCSDGKKRYSLDAFKVAGTQTYLVPAGTRFTAISPYDTLNIPATQKLTISGNTSIKSFGPGAYMILNYSVTTPGKAGTVISGTATKPTHTTTNVLQTQDFIVSVDSTNTPAYTQFTDCNIGNYTGSTWTAGTPTTTNNAIKITTSSVVTSNQFAGSQISGAGIPPMTLVNSNTASTVVGGTNVFYIVLPSGTTITPIFSNTEHTSIYTIGVTLVQASSLIIPAGSQSIPCYPFTPKVNFSAGVTSVILKDPPYYGANSLQLMPSATGNSEITIYPTGGWSGWTADNSVSVTAGNIYGFAGYAKIIVGTDTPTFGLYIDWYDDNGNFISSSNGAKSLTNPSQTNTIPSVTLGKNSGTLGWIPNAIVAKAPENTVVASGATFFTKTSGGASVTATGALNSNSLTLSSVTGLTILAGTILTVGTASNVENVQVASIAGNVLTLTQNLVNSHTSDPISLGSSYTFSTGITNALSSNTLLSLASGGQVLTTAPVASGAKTIPVQFVSGYPSASADTITISATIACPRILLSGVSSNKVFSLSGLMFKSLTPSTSSGGTALSTELPGLSSPITALTSGPSANHAFILPSTTPTEGGDTLYLFDPVNDSGSREIHQGGGDPVLVTMLTKPVSVGTQLIVLDSVVGLAVGSTMYINVYGLLPKSSKSSLTAKSGAAQAQLTTSENTAASRTAGSFVTTPASISSISEQVIIDPSWDGSKNVYLQLPLANSYPAGTQIIAFSTSIGGSFLNNQLQNTPVAVFNWNKSGYTNTPNTSYKFKIERSEDYGVTWTTLWNGSNVDTKGTNQAQVTDWDVIPGLYTSYRATATFQDSDKNHTETIGVPSLPVIAPSVSSSTWWISSTSDETVRYPINVQNNVQETQKHPAGVYYPLGSSRPLTIAGVVQGRDATITVVWTDDANWNDFITLLNKGETLILIDPVESERRYIFINGDVQVTHHAAANPYREVAISYIEAAPPNFGYTYGS